MALDKTALKSDIKTLLSAMVGYDGSEKHTQREAIEKFATDLSEAIDKYVKKGEVSTTVTGTCPQGAVTGTGKGGIS